MALLKTPYLKNYRKGHGARLANVAARAACIMLNARPIRHSGPRTSLPIASTPAIMRAAKARRPAAARRRIRKITSRRLALDLRLIDVGVEQRIDVGVDIRPDAHHPAFAVRVFVDQLR